jgi:hypothetical protein
MRRPSWLFLSRRLASRIRICSVPLSQSVHRFVSLLTARLAAMPSVSRAFRRQALACRKCPQSDSNRHWADFKNVSVGYCDQRKQVAKTSHIGCKRAYLGVAGTDAVRLRYGTKSPPVAGVKPG